MMHSSNYLLLLALVVLSCMLQVHAMIPSGDVTVAKAKKAETDNDIYLIVLKETTHARDIPVLGSNMRRRRMLNEVSGFREFFATSENTKTIVQANALSKEEIDELKNNPDVLSIEHDTLVYAQDFQNPAGQWGLDKIDGTRDNKYEYHFQGDDSVMVYVLDTGGRTTHNEFENRMTSGMDFTSGDQTGEAGQVDCHGHGTHVASTVGGAEYGVAKNVRITPLKVLTCGGGGSISGIVNAMDWASEHANNNDLHGIVSMSLGGGYSEALNVATDNVYKAGLIASVAAGNSNADACNYSPASTPSAVTVGSTTTDDDRSSFSNWGDCVDIFAPGSNIKGAWIDNDSDTVTISGTSMATPHVTGVLSLLWQAFPTEDNQQIIARLYDLAVDDVSNPNGDQGSLRTILDADATSAPVTPTAPTFEPTFKPTSSPTNPVEVVMGDESFEYRFGDWDGDSAEDVPTGDFEGKGVWASPALGCEALDNDNLPENPIFFIDRGDCYFTDKIKNAQNLGAVAVIIVAREGEELPNMVAPTPEEGDKVTVPALTISYNDGLKAKYFIEQGDDDVYYGSGESPEPTLGCKTKKLGGFGNSKFLGKKTRCLSSFVYKNKYYSNECVTTEKTPRFGKKGNQKPEKYLKEIEGWCFTSEDQSSWAACSCGN